jgi:hypothetical protein
MRMRLAAVAALATGLLLAAATIDQATARGGGFGGMGGAHFSGGMGAAHFGGMGGPHVGGGWGGAHVGGMGGPHFAGMGGPHFAHVGGPHVGNWHGGHLAYSGGWQGARGHWNGGPAVWHGSRTAWRDHQHFDHFDHHHHFHNRFVAVGFGWWPGYYDYGYGYGGCGWLYRRAVVTGSPYWWDRYYACAGYY